MLKRFLSFVLCLVMILSFVIGCTTANQVSLVVQPVEAGKTAQVVTGKAPKYIFMFIGDGMAAVQVNSAQIYGGTNKHSQMALDKMNFQGFEAVGYQTTQDATSFAPDSASTATSLSSGFKTWSGTLGLKPIGDKSGNSKTIAAEILHTFVGCIGLVLVSTLTSLICGFIFERE